MISDGIVEVDAINGMDGLLGKMTSIGHSDGLFYHIVNNQELLAVDRAEILLEGRIRMES